MTHHSAPILIVMTGHAIEPVRSQYGDFDDQFAQLLSAPTVSYVICEDWPRVPLPDPTKYAGVIISGSASMLDEKKPWMFAALDLVRQTIRVGTPLLGICFGHQLLGLACGARVGPNPKGRQCGTSFATRLPKADPLFDAFPLQIATQVSHRDVILETSPLFDIIGTSPHDPRHLIRVGTQAWGVQFHPEWDVAITQGYLKARQSILENDWGKERYAHEVSNVTSTPEARTLLKHFAHLCY